MREGEWRSRYYTLCYRLEQVFLSKLEESDPDLFVFGAGECMRKAFEKFLSRRIDERQEPEVRDSVAQIMAAYDRAHGTFQHGEWTIDYEITDLRNPRIRMECGGALARKGGDNQ